MDYAKSLPIFLLLCLALSHVLAQSPRSCVQSGSDQNRQCQRQPDYSDGGEISLFVRTHQDNLARDIAKGRGDHLSAFAELLGIARLEQTSFALILQRNFPLLFPGETQSPQQLISRMVDLLSANNLAVRPTR